ncbi:MarR family transcriptional regulator [uncultured Clostridium sp.]|uniref:MarR family winged helix-turn-helix transcriptional regulator n=1 Tax=uncultured Clostridium sp. TaxID=59620 RepID=UPI0028F05290|nr:MarR family transcriptional regulator [uncultured Clostridium sp.]
MLIKEIYSSTVGAISCGLKEVGLTHQQIMVIKLIAHNKKVNISELCEKMSLSKGTVSGIVTRLEALGYVKKVKSEDDKRNTYIIFSDKGLEFAKEYKNKINESFDKVFKNITKEEIVEVKNSLLRLRNKIK